MYNPKKIEEKWQKRWFQTRIYEVDLKKAKRPYYNLMMFPYPSAEGLHVGNVYAFVGSDIYGRYKRMNNFDVFEPIGFDAFGIHSENFALKKNIHPQVLTPQNIEHFRNQLKKLGIIYNWSHEINTTNPEYYKWTQYLFLQLFKAGLVYRKKAFVNYCPSCKTVLADEQVISGKCERCSTFVIQKETEQWFLKITKYAEKLLKNLKCLPAEAYGPKVKITKEMAQAGIDWSETTKTIQRNWIGKSEGAIIQFPISNFQSSIDVFTTRADTLFGCTYLVISPEHKIISKLKSQISNLKEVENYIKKAKKKTEFERAQLIKEKTGLELKRIKAINPANKKEIAIFVADYIVPSYATGAVMAVPAHDQRDFEFAKKHNLEIIEVISPDKKTHKLEKAYIDKGFLINSGKFNGMDSEMAKKEIRKFVKGEKKINYHLRDWLISRQRYWGPPIPLVFCKNCKKQVESLRDKKKFSKGEIENPGWIAVPEKDLPVLLPYIKDFRPTGTGKSPLSLKEDFLNTTCPKCGKAATRETDVSDTFFDSSWYFLRYPSTEFSDKPFDKKLTKKWLPVNMYIGGQEHACLHLLYTRFVTMVLNDLGFIDFKEPFKKFRAHGLITKDGAKMSKSKGNVVIPDGYIENLGADCLRTYLMFIGPFTEGGAWQDAGIKGIWRFLNKIWNLKSKVKSQKLKVKNQNSKLDKLLHKTIKKVTEDIENLRYNTAISALMILTNEMEKANNLFSVYYQTLLKLLAPFAPHFSEELWHQLEFKNSIHNQVWPKYSPELIEEEFFTLIIQVNGKFRDRIEIKKDIKEKEAKEIAFSSEKIKKWIDRKKIKKIIFVPGKLINIVV